MTREEEILNKAIDYSFIEDNYLEYDDCGDICDDRDFIQKAYMDGAKWADENQPCMSKMKKDYELLFLLKKREIIKKAKKWMESQTYQEFPGAPHERLISDEMIENFEKTMEE